MPEQNVFICNDLNKELQGFLAALAYDRLFVLTDTHTSDACLPLLRDIPAIQAADCITVPAGDTHKEVEQLSAIWRHLSRGGASRESALLNLGGGMVCDMGGFAGATFKRGIRTLNVPTTLMASVDAAIGGKTAINFDGLKNEVGAFHPPLAVFIDCRFLHTLDRDNLLSGYAEMLKHGLISNEQTLADVLAFDPGIHPDYDRLNRMVACSVAVKERIVTEDPKEKGIRKALNFGHTIGHAFESLSFQKGDPILHGHAVAAGIVSELYLSAKDCGFPITELRRTVHYIKTYYPPLRFVTCKDYDALYELMTHDKKNEGGVINFTLLSGIGQVRINRSVGRDKILEALDFYRESFGI